MRSLVIPIFLYACDSWILTADVGKRTHTFKISGYRRLLNISYKDHITNEEVRRKVQAAIGEYDDLSQDTEAKMVWPHFIVFSFSKGYRKETVKEADRRRGQKTI